MSSIRILPFCHYLFSSSNLLLFEFSTLCTIERMRSHVLSIVLVLIIFSSSKIYCFSRLSNNIRREDLSDDLFTNQDGNQDLPLLSSEDDDVGLLVDQDLLFQDESNSEDLNNLGSIIVNPSEKIAQGSSCEHSVNKREGLLEGKYQIFIWFHVPCGSYWTLKQKKFTYRRHLWFLSQR